MILLVNNSNEPNDELSYIRAIRHTLRKCKIKFIETNRNSKTSLPKKGIKGIILSGSSLTISQKTVFEDYANDIQVLLQYQVPVLGICFGCQMIHVIFGGTLQHGKRYICDELPVILDSRSKLFNGLSPEQVVKFCFSDLPIHSTMKPIATLFHPIKKQMVPCAYEKGHFYALLFHPEAIQETWIIFQNFYSICCL